MSRPVLLLLPGMTLNASIFPAFENPSIAVDFTTLVLGPDGSSAELASRRMSLYAELLDRRLADQSSWQAERRIVVAHSFGGMLALAWWLGHRGAGPANIDGLVLVSTVAGPMFEAARVRVGRLGTFEARLGLRTLVRLWNLPPVTRAAKRWFTNGRLEAQPVDFRALPSKSDWAMDRAGWRNTDWRSMRSYRMAMQGFDVRPRLGEIGVPTIVLHGDRDSLFSLENARALAEGLRNGELRLVPGAGHGLPLTHGDAVVRAVNDLTVGRLDG